MKNGPYVDDRFSRLFYEREVPFGLTWMGRICCKCPFDMWMYAEIIHATRPDIIIETGTFDGGSALFLAHMLDIVGNGKIISVDIRSDVSKLTDGKLPEHPRIEFLAGLSSTDPRVLEHVTAWADGRRGMVILDSAHNEKHVLDEIRLYHKFVAKGSYLIVEDTNVHGYQFAVGDIEGEHGPAEAVKAFQPKNHGFEVDRSKERLLMSQNPGGYLRRVN